MVVMIRAIDHRPGVKGRRLIFLALALGDGGREEERKENLRTTLVFVGQWK